MADVNQIAQQFNAHCPGAEMVLSAAVEPGFKDKLGITVITARGKKETEPVPREMPVEAPAIEKPKRKSSTRRRKAKQQELQLQDVSKGRFEKAEPTLHEGKDLDVPTFIRRNLALK